MVKFPLIFVTALCATLVYGEGIANVNQCMNTNLTADVLSGFPSNATATAQNCVLAFVKGSVNGDLRTFASPFSAEIRSSEFGFSDLENIPATATTEFAALMASISNCTSRIVSYSETTNNGLIKANITIHRQGANHDRAEVAHLDIAQTNNVWSIVSWDVDE